MTSQVKEVLIVVGRDLFGHLSRGDGAGHAGSLGQILALRLVHDRDSVGVLWRALRRSPERDVAHKATPPAISDIGTAGFWAG
jgi:hypothetical protein